MSDLVIVEEDGTETHHTIHPIGFWRRLWRKLATCRYILFPIFHYPKAIHTTPLLGRKVLSSKLTMPQLAARIALKMIYLPPFYVNEPDTINIHWHADVKGEGDKIYLVTDPQKTLDKLNRTMDDIVGSIKAAEEKES